MRRRREAKKRRRQTARRVNDMHRACASGPYGGKYLGVSMNVFDIVTIERHRFHTDGKGVTTLVILNGCPLQCRYCINGKLLAGAKTKK